MLNLSFTFLHLFYLLLQPGMDIPSDGCGSTLYCDRNDQVIVGDLMCEVQDPNSECQEGVDGAADFCACKEGFINVDGLCEPEGCIDGMMQYAVSIQDCI